MKKIWIYSLILILSISFVSCFDDQDDNPIPDIEVKDFVWKGLNLWYFWQQDVPDLLDDRFTTDAEYTAYLNSFSSPDQLFESLKFTDDRFSVITDDYFALNNALNGISKSNGMEFGLLLVNGGPNVLGYVQYVLPNSDAETQNIQRGDLFLTVDGVQLTETNYRSLLFSDNDTYTIGLAEIDNSNNLTLTGESKTLTKVVYTENPIHIANTFTVDGIKVGYLMYNRFLGDFDETLNTIFAQFVAEGVQELVLDLRYNPGGSVNSAINLSSMVAGRPETDLFLKQRWNDKLQVEFEDDVDRFFASSLANGTPINTLNLSKVYVLAQGTSASASELLINGLNPYMEVIHIGDTTVGKNEFSTTLFDIPSCGFVRGELCEDNPNPNHTWAMQPLVGKNENAVGFLDYEDGFTPQSQFILPEDLTNLGVLGDQTEPLLARAIQHITGNGRLNMQTPKDSPFTLFDNSNAHTLTRNNMYVEPKTIPNF